MKDNYSKLANKFNKFNKKSKEQDIFLLGYYIYIRNKKSFEIFRIKILEEELEKYDVNKLYKWLLDAFKLK